MSIRCGAHSFGVLLGRVLTESRKGTDNTTMLLSSSLYDLGGRMKSTKNALDEETTYTETTDGLYVISTETMLPLFL